MKRKVSLLLAMIFTFVSVFAVAFPASAFVSKGKINIWAKYTPEITVSTVKGLADNLTTHPKKPKEWNTENNPWAWQYKKELGIKVKCLWEVPNTQYEQKMAVAIASNQLPDIFQVNAVQLNKVVKMGVAQDITKVYKDYVSPWAKSFTNDGGMAIKQATFGGKLMALPLTSGNVDSAVLLWIRQDWLNKLGLKAPKTMAEFEKVAEAFTTRDPDGNGKNDTYGFSFQKEFMGTQGNSGALPGFFNSYGTNTSGFVKSATGKELVSGLIQPSVKTGLTQLARMYKAGYIDQEFAVKDFAKIGQDLVGDKVGMFYGEHWNAFWPLGDAQKANKNVIWRAVPIPTVDGKPAKVNIGLSAGSFYVVNKSLKKPEAAIKMFNMAMKYEPAPSPDYRAIFHFGTQDPKNPKMPLPDGDMQLYQYAVIYNFSPTQNIDIFHDYKALATSTKPVQTKWTKVSKQEISILKERWNIIVKSGKIPADGRQLDYVDYYGIRHNKPTDKLFDASTFYGGGLWIWPYGAFWTIDQYLANKQLQTPLFYGAPTNTMTSKGTTLNKMCLESFTKIIMGKSDISAFDKFVKDWKTLGGNAITKEVNAWYKANK